MSKKQFEVFLRKEEEKKLPSIDWGARRDQWLKTIDKLYKAINSWLKEYIDAKSISLSFNKLSIFENPLGEYTTHEMTIRIGNKSAKLTPIGTILISAKGRIDMIGARDTVRFILADKDAIKPKLTIKIASKGDNGKQGEQKGIEKPLTELVWKISSGPPDIKYTDLNQDTFLNCLMKVCNG